MHLMLVHQPGPLVATVWSRHTTRASLRRTTEALPAGQSAHWLLALVVTFVAAGVGLQLFWVWVTPDPRTRLTNLVREGRTAAGMAIGLVFVLLLSG